MGCNCASQEYIKNLHKMYGEKIKTNEKKTLDFQVKKWLRYIGVGVIVLLLSPILLTYVLYRCIFKNGYISMKVLMGSGEGVSIAMAKEILDNVNSNSKYDDEN